MHLKLTLFYVNYISIKNEKNEKKINVLILHISQGSKENQ